MDKRQKTRRRAAGIGAGVALLVGLGGITGVPAQAAVGFNPSAADARLGGADRYQTAALIAQKYWTASSTVIVANGETNGIDALSASYLAGVKQAPILLTSANSVPAATAAAIEALNPSEVIVIGGEPSVSTATFAELTAGRTTGKRISGIDRFDTAAKIIAEARAALPANAPAPAAILARGDVYGTTIAADALSASPLGYRGIPIVLTAQGSLPGVSASALASLKPTSLTALGSTQSISAATASAAASAAGVPTASRLEGTDRSATAVAIATSDLATSVGLGKTAVGLANGFRVDALAAGPAAGKAGYPLLLTESAQSLGSATEAYLRANSGNLISGQIFGDASAVSTSVTDAAVTSGGGVPSSGQVAPVSNPVAGLPANLDNQGDQPDVRVSFGLSAAPVTSFTVQRVSSSNAAVSSPVNLTGQDVTSGSFIDYDVPLGSWVYRITVTSGGATSTVVTQTPVSIAGAPVVNGQPTGLTPGSNSVTLTFDQPVSGLSLGEVTSSNGSLSFTPTAVAPSGGRSATWTLAVAGGTLQAGNTVTLAAGSVVNAQGVNGPATGFTSAPVVAAPTVSVAGLQPGSSSLTYTFDQPVSGFTAADLTSNNGVLTFTPSATLDANGRASVWTVAIGGGTLAASNTVTLSANAVVNGQGGTGPSSPNVQTVLAAPVASFSNFFVGASYIHVDFNVGVTGLEASDFTLPGGQSILGVSSHSPQQWHVDLASPVAAGETYTLAANSVVNSQGTTGPVTAFTASIAAAPSVSAVSGWSPNTTSFTITFDQAVSGFTDSEVTSSGAGNPVFSVAPQTAGATSDTTWVVTVSSGTVSSNDTFTVSANAVQNADGTSGPTTAYTSSAA
ncbi:cell wall-binding repeat-containing protein [Kineococcus sp. TBRC 1896]|uniref:Cell wall-binding repeat-containing protein n=1 Tax=Kineococcus mangrovi TaxID=1660183 RepID=A0ABV4IB40_9ACTN